MKLDISPTETPEQLFKKIMDNQEKIINYYKEKCCVKKNNLKVLKILLKIKKKSFKFYFYSCWFINSSSVG